MAAAERTRSKQRGQCAKSRQLVRWGCVLFWCAVWVWFGARTLRAANRVLACQQFGCACPTQPVSGRVLNSYSGDELVYSKTLGDWRTHNGVDYAADRGAEVTAPAAGKVVETGTDDKWGPVVAIEDASGRVWRVCGTTDAKVKKGDTVSAGQTIGKVGSVSCECAEESHIHLEVMEGEKYLDPIKAMK